MNLKLLLGLLFIVWRSASAEEYTNHWRATEDVANVEFCSHDSFKNGSCLCNVDYTGNFCLNRKCRNFGFDGNLPKNPVKVDRCTCPPGFLGRNCEPVACVPGKDQLYKSSKSEKTISLLASYNTKLKATWATGDIGKLICNKTDYGRNFNYNYENANFYTKTVDSSECIEKLGGFLTEDPCMDDNDKPIPCVPLDINNLYSLVQYSPANSIIFVVTNMGAVSNTDDLAEKIIATSIANRIQINVVVYNNTGFYADDAGLVYLSKIASATLGTYVLPSIKSVNEQYDVVSALLDNWDQGYQVTKVFTEALPNLPVDNNHDLYVAVQTYYGEDAIFNFEPLPTVVQKTDFWKLYKLTAESYNSILTVSNQIPNTSILAYTSGGLIAYSAFTSDENGNMAVDAAYSVSVNQTAYSMVARFETGTGALDFEVGYRILGTPNTISFVDTFYNRSFCQFNFIINAKCNSVGPSIVTAVTASNRDSVSFPVYCASYNYAKSIYNDFVSQTVAISHSQYPQSFSKDFKCSSDIDHERYAGRTFVIVAENTKDSNGNLSSVDNVFRNKNSVFYPLSKFVSTAAYTVQKRYTNFLSVLTNGTNYVKKQSGDYGIFMSLVMDTTSNSSAHTDAATPISVKDILTDTIEAATDYSDIFMIINYNVSTSDEDSTAIKTALSKQRSRLFVLFVQTYITYDAQYQYMNDLAIASGGVAVRLNSYEDLSTFFNQYYPVLVANDIVAKAYSENQRAGIALNNVNLLQQDYYLLLTNEDLVGDGPVTATINVAKVSVSNPLNLGELQLFVLTPSVAGIYDIPILFSTSGLAQYSNAILYANTNSQDFISLSFVNSDGVNQNQVTYNAGAFRPVIYSSTPFSDGSTIAITYSDKTNPAKPIYNGSITAVSNCSLFKNYLWTTNYDWICSQSDGLYHFKIDRKTDGGPTITRTFPITCLGADTGDCLNGGLETDTGCSCPLEWSGSNCQTPNCLNGGTVTTANTCECIPAFTGSFCESTFGPCLNSPSLPDYRADLSSLIIVADVNALTTGGITTDIGVTGVPITVVLYGDDNGPRIVQSTTNSQHLAEVLGPRTAPTSPSTTVSPSAAPASSDMYKALNLALDNQLTNRALIVVYTSNADVPVDSDFLIRLAVKRAEIRVLSVTGTESQNSQTLSLVGNGIPVAVTGASDFQNYLTTYIGPLFQSLGYQANVPQRVFNVFKTDQLTGPTNIVIPKDSTFDNALADLFVHVYKGYIQDMANVSPIGGTTQIYHIPNFNQKDGKSFTINWSNTGVTGFYAVETVGYLKTAYGFNKNNTNGSNEMVNAGVTYSVDNTLHIYTAPYYDLADANPANFPYLSIKQIMGDGSLSNSTTVLFTRKSHASCFFQYFTILDVCSVAGTIGYQVQLTTRAGVTETRQQQFVLTCFKTTYQSAGTSCHGHGSPKETCACDPNYGGIDCTEPVCANGIRDMSVCRCPIDYFGLRCEQNFNTAPPTTPSVSTITPSISTSVSPSASPSTTPNTPSTTAGSTVPPKVVRVAAFILDLLGPDGYAFNQSTASIAAYYKAFSYTDYVMMIGNLQQSNINFTFQQYADDKTLLNRTSIFWNLRFLPDRVSDVSLALTEILKSYNAMKTQFTSASSLNIFYVTQIGLNAADTANVAAAMVGLEDFQKSSIVYSTFSKDADPAVLAALTPFSANVSSTRDYYGGVMTMISETSNNASAVLPDKPATKKCVYPLQTNIRVAIDRSLQSSNAVNGSLDTFLQLFQQGFNYIENDVDRCSEDVLPTFYTERPILTAFPYYDTFVQTSKFCPSQYTSMMSYPVTGKNPSPTYSDKLMANIGKQINSASCKCNRFDDDKTMKIVLWLPRSAGPVTDNYLNYLKLNTTNAYHFVVPFYDVTDKDNDLYYQILNSQPKGGDYYLLPNAATAANIQTDVIDVLYDKLCETAGVDPTAVPPSLIDDNIENRHYDYYY